MLILSGAWDFLLATARFLAFISIGVLALGVRFDLNLLALAPLAALSLLSFTALGLLAAALILVAKRGDSLALLVNLVANVFGGVVFPVTLLPGWVRPFAYLVPLSYALDGLRRAALVAPGRARWQAAWPGWASRRWCSCRLPGWRCAGRSRARAATVRSPIIDG